MVTLFTPDVRIEVDGIDRTLQVWKYIESISYDDAENGESDSLSFTLANSPAFAIPAPGAKVRFWLGWKEQELKYFGVFVVDEISIELQPAKMRVCAKSANFNSASKGSKSEKERRDREWENISLADLARKVAAEHGGTSKVEVEIHYPHIAQTNEGNLSFLQRLASEVGAMFAVKDDTILIYPPDKGSRNKTVLRYTQSVSGNFTAKAREEYTEVEAKWWSKGDAKEKRVSSKRGKKKEKWWHSAGDNRNNSGTTKHAIKKRYHSASEAQTAAKNNMARLERGEFEGDILLPGDPTLVAGAEVQLEGFKPEGLNGRYIAKTVSHLVSKSGWTTRVSIESLD